MNLKELKESLNEVKASKKELLTKAVVEVRSLEASENEELRQLDEKISDLQNQIQTAEEELRSNVVEENIKTEGEGKMNKQEMEIRAIENFIKNGVVSEEVRATNTSANNTSIQPVYIQNEIVRRLEELCPVFAKAKRYEARAGELKIPREAVANLWEFGFVGEDADVAEHTFSFDTISLKQVRVGASVKVTQHLLNDVEMDIVGYVVDMLARRLGATLYHQSINGTGVQGEDLQGLAVLTKDAHGINEVNADALDADVLLDAIHAMHPSLLNGAEFIMSRATYNAVSKLKDLSGQYILKMERSVAPEAPRYQVFGFPVHVTEDIADDKVLFVNVAQACATMIKKGTQMIRISNDTQNALRGTHTFVIDAYVDFRLRDAQAVVAVNIGEDGNE
ncbi:MAG: phage major capsid protein [Turicibacter sp.]|nr:phage major capsid protein [Turicibacter sp.]